MRIFGIILLSFCLCFASILSLNEAFNVKSNLHKYSKKMQLKQTKYFH